MGLLRHGMAGQVGVMEQGRVESYLASREWSESQRFSLFYRLQRWLRRSK